MMKQRYGILALLLSMTQVLGAFTRLTPESYHFFVVEGSLGYASLTNSSSSLRSGNGAAANLGIGYRVYHNHFLFSTGLQGYYLYNVHSMQDVSCEFDEVDNEGDAYHMVVDASNGTDVCNAVSLNLPVLFGAEYRRFYFLMGPTLSYNLWGNATASASLSEKAQYVEFEGVVENMTGRFENQTVTQTERIEWNIDLMAHFEIGMRLGDLSFQTGADVPKPKQRYYIAVYVDYGLLNLRSAQSLGSRLWYEGTGFDKTYHLTPAVMSTELRQAEIHQYSVGIKATVLLELPRRRPCVICTD